MNGEVAEEVAEATSSTSPEVGADVGAGGGGQGLDFFFFSFFRVFGWPMAYIPVAPDSFKATGCPRSRVYFLNIYSKHSSTWDIREGY